MVLLLQVVLTLLKTRASEGRGRMEVLLRVVHEALTRRKMHMHEGVRRNKHKHRQLKELKELLLQRSKRWTMTVRLKM